MNDRRSIYYPVILYTFILVAVWLCSWLVSVLQLLSGGEMTVTSLVSGEGVRWALLTVQDTLNAAPWGCVLFMLLVAGLSCGSGFIQSLSRMFVFKGISANERHALLSAAVTVFLYSVVIMLFTVYPWHILLGVTGVMTDSPLVSGWILVLFVGVMLASLVYGFIYGNYRTMTDVAGSAADFAGRFMPALLAMIPATGILPCLHFTALETYLGIDGENRDFIAGVLYLLPYLYVAVIAFLGKKR